MRNCLSVDGIKLIRLFLHQFFVVFEEVSSSSFLNGELSLLNVLIRVSVKIHIEM